MILSSCDLFSRPVYEITLDVGKGGSVTLDPEPEDEDEGVYFYEKGTDVTLTAVADSEDYTFGSWSGSFESYDSTVTVSVQDDMEVGADFIRITPYRISLDVGSGGAVDLSPDPVSEEDGVYEYWEGTLVTLTATADADYRFTSWSGSVDTSYAATLAFTAEDDIDIDAAFSSYETTWTVLVYLDGDNSLSNYALTDFDEMETGLYLALQGDADIQDKLAVVVQLDRYNAFYDFDGQWSTARRYWVMPDNADGFGSNRLSDLGEVNMGDPAVLKDFIDYGMSQFPAAHYALILWNHGSGARSLEADIDTRAICEDDTSNDFLYMGEITDGLGLAESVELLGMDACLMGTAEVAYEYRPKSDGFGADYLVASPASEQGDGWEYNKIFNRFSGSGSDNEGDTCYDADTVTAEQIARLMVKEYMDAFGAYAGQTMSAYDLSKADEAKTAVDALAAALEGYQEGVENLEIWDNGVYYGDADSWYDIVACPYYELGDLCDLFSDTFSTDTALTAACTDVHAALGNLILASWAGSSYGGYNNTGGGGVYGVSIFFSAGDSYKSYDTNSYSEYQSWYTSDDMKNTSFPYGNLDFCDYDTDGTVDTWKELFEEWYP